MTVHGKWQKSDTVDTYICISVCVQHFIGLYTVSTPDSNLMYGMDYCSLSCDVTVGHKQTHCDSKVHMYNKSSLAYLTGCIQAVKVSALYDTTAWHR